MQEPRLGKNGDAAWQERELTAVILHSPGHWVPYIRVQGVWWEVDTVI